MENFVHRLEDSVMTATRKLETGSFVHSFVTYLILHLNFSIFFQWPERDWIFINAGTNSVVMHNLCITSSCGCSVIGSRITFSDFPLIPRFPTDFTQ
jgi:hypothetical protein